LTLVDTNYFLGVFDTTTERTIDFPEITYMKYDGNQHCYYNESLDLIAVGKYRQTAVTKFVTYQSGQSGIYEINGHILATEKSVVVEDNKIGKDQAFSFHQVNDYQSLLKNEQIVLCSLGWYLDRKMTFYALESRKKFHTTDEITAFYKINDVWIGFEKHTRQYQILYPLILKSGARAKTAIRSTDAE
jgi:hypothetical protein